MTVYTQQANEWDTASTLRSPGKGELIGFAERKPLSIAYPVTNKRR